MQRFLEDEAGPVDQLLMHCLKPHFGSGIRLQDTPSHLPDEGLFSLSDVICGPLHVIPHGAEYIDVPDYQKLYLKLLDRAALV